jgi:ABC-type multidrug transport system fused ATPase/permease subunit
MPISLQGCDRIYVMSDGLVAEQGTHQQLMAGALPVQAKLAST